MLNQHVCAAFNDEETGKDEIYWTNISLQSTGNERLRHVGLQNRGQMETDALTTYGVRPPGTKDAVVWQKVILCHLLKHHTPREHREECLHFFKLNIHAGLVDTHK